MKKQIEIITIEELKSGTSQSGNEWTMWRCETTDGKPYTTFKDLHAAIGKPYWFEVEVSDGAMNKKTGEPFRNHTIVGYTEAPLGAKGAPDEARLKAIEDRLTTIETFVGLK